MKSVFNDKQMHFKYQQRNLCNFEVTKNNNIEVVKISILIDKI